MMDVRWFAGALTAMALGASVLFGNAASAATITATSATLTGADKGTSFEVNYICSETLPCNGGSPYSTLQARTTFFFADYLEDTANSIAFWKFDLTIRNTSFLVAGGFLTAVGFAVDPDAIVDSFWDSNVSLADWTVQSGASIPGFSATEICVFSGSSCSSTSDNSMTTGTQDRVSFWLATDLSKGNSLTFNHFAASWAGNAVTGGSYQASVDLKVAPVPLPAAGWLLLAGIVGLAAQRRRKAGTA